MKRLLLVVGVVSVAAVGVSAFLMRAEPAPAQSGAPKPVPQPSPSPATFDAASAFEHLRAMVEIGPRPSGSPGIRQTRAYITRQISAMGLTVQEQKFTGATPLGPIEMINLIVTLPGKRLEKILITGHYDTKLFKDQVFVGANDGGSSGAFLIELARVLKQQPHEYTYELVWFDGEEAVVEWQGNDNTYGSRYYVQAAQKAKAIGAIKAMILVDMIGERGVEIKRESNSTPWLTDIVWAAAKRVGHGGTFVDVEAGQISDDHLPFLAAKVPSVDLIDIDYPAWHHTNGTDTIDKVAPRSLQIVGEVVLAALPDIEKRLLAGK